MAVVVFISHNQSDFFASNPNKIYCFISVNFFMCHCFKLFYISEFVDIFHVQVEFEEKRERFKVMGARVCSGVLERYASLCC